jgi:hypothetical protein
VNPARYIGILHFTIPPQAAEWFAQDDNKFLGSVVNEAATFESKFSTNEADAKVASSFPLLLSFSLGFFFFHFQILHIFKFSNLPLLSCTHNEYLYILHIH